MMKAYNVAHKAVPVLCALVIAVVCIALYTPYIPYAQNTQTTHKTQATCPRPAVEHAGPDTVRPEPRPGMTSIRPKPAPEAVWRTPSLH